MKEMYNRFKRFFQHIHERNKTKLRKKRYIAWKKKNIKPDKQYKFQYFVSYYYDKFYPAKNYHDKKTGVPKVRAPFYKQVLKSKKKGTVIATDSISALLLVEQKYLINSYSRDFSIKVSLTKRERKKLKDAKEKKIKT